MICRVWLNKSKPAFIEILSLHRPLIFKTEADWEREKNAYVNSVARHLRENANAAPGILG